MNAQTPPAARIKPESDFNLKEVEAGFYVKKGEGGLVEGLQDGCQFLFCFVLFLGQNLRPMEVPSRGVK